MAWQVSKRVWSHAKKVTGSEKIMLLALADKADEHGVCLAKYDTSYETLADMVGVNRRSAMRLIDNLCKTGHICKIEAVGRGHSNTFFVLTGLEQEEIIDLLIRNGVTDDTNYEPEKVLSETPKDEEMVLSLTPNGVTDDTNYGVNGVTHNTQPIYKNSSYPTKRESPAKILETHKDLALRLISLCGYQHPKFVVNGKLTECSEAVTQLVEWEATPALLGEFNNYWWGDNSPTFKQVVDYWGKFLEWRQKPKREKNTIPPNKSSPPIDKAAYDKLRLEDQQQIYNPLGGG